MEKEMLKSDPVYAKYVADFSAYASEQIETIISNGGFIFKVENRQGSYTATNPDIAIHYFANPYHCNTCNDFLKHYGVLVGISDDCIRTVIGWTLPEELIPEKLKDAHRSMIDVCLTSPIAAPVIFNPNVPVLGSIEKGGYSHLHIVLPEQATEQAVFVKARGIPTNAGALRGRFNKFRADLGALNAENISSALAIINKDGVNQAKNFKYQANLIAMAKNALISDFTNKDDVLWNIFMGNYSFLQGVNNTVIGEFINDLGEGNPQAAIDRFNFKTAPENYMRPTTEPSDDEITQAEKIIAEFNLERSLERRYARFEDLEKRLYWKPITEAEKDTEIKQRSPLDKLRVKKEVNSIELPKKSISFKSFKQDVLPQAVSIKLIVPGTAPFVALLTAAHEDAEPILRYDHKENRNPISTVMYIGEKYNYSNLWGLKANDSVDVIGFITSVSDPNTGEAGHTILLIKGCRNQVCGGATGSGLFPEIIRPELYPVRKVIEAYSNTTLIQDKEGTAQAGILIAKRSTDNPINCKLTVKDRDGFVTNYCITSFE